MIDNQTIINFKQRILSFEDSEIRVVMLIDPLEGHRYVEPMNNEGEGDYLDHIYNIMSLQYDYINPTSDGNLSWQSVISCTSDSGDAFKNWQNQMHEVSM